MAPNGHLAQCCGSVDQPPHFINIMKVSHYNVEYADVTKKCCCDCIILSSGKINSYGFAL